MGKGFGIIRTLYLLWRLFCATSTAALPQLRGLALALSWTTWVVGIQTSRGHHGTSEFLGGKHDLFRIVITGDLRNEAVAFADYGPNETWLDIIIIQGDTNLADRGVNSLFDIDEEILTPQFRGNLLAGQNVGLIIDQQHEQLHGKAFQTYGSALAEKLEPTVIQFELVEPDLLLRHVPNLQ